MNIWELPKEHYNWESPITKIYGDIIHNEIIRQDEENYTYAVEQAIGYKVDKKELIKALNYDREQYEKGYSDGVKETFISELEKIKQEIGRIETEEGGDFLERPAIDIIYESQKILDKHISELKGE